MELNRVLKVLIVAEIAFLVLGVGAGIWLADSLPVDLRRYLASRSNEPFNALDVIGILLLLLLAVGLYGLWTMKSWARLVYTTASVFLLIVGFSLGPSVMNGVEYVVGEAATLVTGMTLALIWFSQLSERFRAKSLDPE